jgi:F0F1-type ATP synthase assembly protein I
LRSERRRQAETARRIADASAMGLAFPIAILLGYFWGKGMDSLFGTAPWLMYIFSGLGVAAGFLNAIRVAMRVGKEEDDAKGPPHGGEE